MNPWLENNIVGIISALLGIFIAYHVYFLSKRLTFKDRLVHKDEIRKRVEQIWERPGRNQNPDIELINIRKYPKHYLGSNIANRHGYTYLKGELKDLRFDGVELFCAVRELYEKPDGTLTLDEDLNTKRQDQNAYEVGVIPYEWIEYVDKKGDEFSYRPQFFVRFKGSGKSPYKYFTYYVESDNYIEGSDPPDFQWRQIDVETPSPKA